jgi:hypothetical protein
MKTKLLSLLFSLMLISAIGNSQTLLVENFDYTAGDSLTAHGWVSFSGGITNRLVVTSPGLTFNGYSLSGIGNATRISNNGQDAYKQFTADSVGNLYISMMVKIDSIKTGDYFVAMLPSTSTTNYTSRLYAKDDGGTISFGLSKGASSGGPIVYGANGFALGTTYLLVVKYVFNTTSTSDDEMSLFVISGAIPGTEPTTPYVGPVTGTVADASNLARIALRQGSSASSPTMNIDGIKIGKTWAGITTSVKIESGIADNFSLSQNYPNPFNPTTNIKFSIPSQGFVTLKVYNTLGKEVSSLVGNTLSTGTYEVNFNASNLSSGIYYYKINFTNIEGKNFSDTKKLMLVK